MKTLVKKFLFVGIIVCCLFACSKVEDESKINNEALVGTQSVNLNTAASARGGYPGLEPGEYWDHQKTVNGLQYFVCNKKDGRKWYRIMVPLSRWKLKLGYEIVANANTSNPTFLRLDMVDWMKRGWKEPTAMMINASFFNLNATSLGAYGSNGSRAEVAHPIGENNKIVSVGYDPREQGSRSLIVQNKRAYMISPSYNPSEPMSRPFELLISGLDPSIDKRSTEKIGRVMVGVDSKVRPILHIFITGNGSGMGATQAEAITVLRDYLSCDEILMLDGSASAQFAWGNDFIVHSWEKFPLSFTTRNVPILLRAIKR